MCVSPLSFLDLGLPLWLGGAPSPSPSHVSTTAITACVRQLLVNGDLLDLNSHTDQANSQPGCPQVEETLILSILSYNHQHIIHVHTYYVKVWKFYQLMYVRINESVCGCTCACTYIVRLCVCSCACMCVYARAYE